MSPSPRSARVRHRAAWCTAALLAVTGTGAGLAATAVATSPPKHARPATFDNALIASTALSYAGRWGGQACIDSRHDPSGQCKQFVNCVIALASSGHDYPVDPHGNYQDSFPDAGAVPVTLDDAAAGDVIQVGEHDTDLVLHTAIITARHHGGAFTVVDANWVGSPGTPELVGVHDWTPPAGARFWRLGSPAGTANADAGHAATGSQPLATAPSPPELSTATDARIATGTVTLAVGVAAHPGPGTVTVRVYLDDHPYTTRTTTAGQAVLTLDTRKLPDGPHRLTAQAITATGAISPLSAPTTVAVVNHTFTLAVTAPPGSLAAGLVPVTVATNAPGPLKAVTWTVDGRAAPAENTADGRTWELDTSSLTPGTHGIVVSATDARDRTATSTALPVTVAGAVTANRVALDTTGSGTTDLIGTDDAGRLLRYPALGAGRFAEPDTLWPEHPSTTVRALAGGRFTTPGPPAQLLAIRTDHTARLYAFDTAGHLDNGTPVTGPDWGRYIRVTAGDFTAAGTAQLLGFTADGHADLITIHADGRTATTIPAPGAPATAETTAAPSADTGRTDLLTISPTGTVSAQTWYPGTGFDAGEPLGTTAAPAPGTIPVAGAFTARGAPQLLTTLADGSTLIQPTGTGGQTTPTQPTTAAVFGQTATPPTAQPHHPSPPRYEALEFTWPRRARA